MNREQFLRAVERKHPDAAIVAVATVLHEGWESDNYVALIERGNRQSLVTSDHGVVCGTDTSYLRKARARHTDAITSIDKLLSHVDAG